MPRRHEETSIADCAINYIVGVADYLYCLTCKNGNTSCSILVTGMFFEAISKW